jgi:hypothetical protein
MDNRIYDAVVATENGTTLPVVARDVILDVSDTKLDDAVTDDLLQRLAPFDVVERIRERRRRCHYGSPHYGSP